MLEHAERERLGNPCQPDKPLVRLRVSPILDKLNLHRIVSRSLFHSVTPSPVLIPLCGLSFSPSVVVPTVLVYSFPAPEKPLSTSLPS